MPDLFKMIVRNIKFLIVLSILLIPVILPAQIEINLPKQISVYIESQPWQYSQSWLDELLNYNSSKDLKYKLSGGLFSAKRNITKLEIPQILSINHVLHQVIYYYSSLEENLRTKEKVLVYPFFNDYRDQPYIECRYSKTGKFYFTINRWKQIPVPNKPTDLEISIYNQILNNVFRDNSNFNNISQKYFKKAAKEHNLSTKQVEEIFKNVILWKAIQ